MDIPLSRVYPVSTPTAFKLHLACWNGSEQPLDVFVQNRKEWDGWNAWRGVRDDFSREFIFSLIDFYPERDRWLFGGVYRVLSRKPINHARSYQIELLEESKPFIGRMKIPLKRPSRAKAVNFENHYNALFVSEILPQTYTGEAFCGYDQIDIGFPMMQSIFTIQKQDKIGSSTYGRVKYRYGKYNGDNKPQNAKRQIVVEQVYLLTAALAGWTQERISKWVSLLGVLALHLPEQIENAEEWWESNQECPRVEDHGVSHGMSDLLASRENNYLRQTLRQKVENLDCLPESTNQTLGRVSSSMRAQ